MATDILSIPQIAVPDLANIQNDLHIGLGGCCLRRMKQYNKNVYNEKFD
jgi:hypothetical protein